MNDSALTRHPMPGQDARAECPDLGGKEKAGALFAPGAEKMEFTI